MMATHNEFASEYDMPEPWCTISDIRVWRFTLDLDAWTVRKMRTQLSVEERIRADRFVTDELRSRFVVGRATMRSLLANCIGMEPGRLEFQYGANGKPSLSNVSELHFNLSHSHGCALLAISDHRNVGIDLERIDPATEIESISSRFFTSGECREMLALNPEHRRLRFFDLWCCKEAYLKAVGTGISAGLNTCRVTKSEDGAFAIHNPDYPEHRERWSIHHLAPYDGYSAALCVECTRG